jgi:hypothetical protein
MRFPCARCGQLVAKPVWLMWRGRLSRVGVDCAAAIARDLVVPGQPLEAMGRGEATQDLEGHAVRTRRAER